MKQQNSKWYERYTVTPHPLGTMWTLWGIRGIVPEALGDYPTQAEAEEVKGKLELKEEQEVKFPRLRAYENNSGWSEYARLFAASPELLGFAEAYLEAVEDAEGDGDEVEALARMAERARAAVDKAKGAAMKLHTGVADQYMQPEEVTGESLLRFLACRCDHLAGKIRLARNGQPVESLFAPFGGPESLQTHTEAELRRELAEVVADLEKYLPTLRGLANNQ